MVHMGPDPIDAVAFFQRAEQLFTDYGVPETFKANLIGPFLNQKAKQMLARLTPDVSSKYSSLKDEILCEMKLSAATYLQRFNTTVKSDDETFVAYASRLQGLLSYYLDSRKVRKFDELRELLLCDRLKSVLSENCLKYVLSIESGLDKGWLPLKDLTEYVDRFVASKGDSVKPKAFAIGQTPTKLFKPNNDKFGDKLGVGLAYTPKSGKPLSSPGAAGGNFTPVKQTICYTCQKPGHISRNCPSAKKFGTTPQASAKRVAVMDLRPGSIICECGENSVVGHNSKSMPDQTQISKVDHSTSTDHDF